jgi:hypothetical protein
MQNEMQLAQVKKFKPCTGLKMTVPERGTQILEHVFMGSNGFNDLE